MGLKAIHDSVDEIPEEFRPLYTEKAGKYELTGIEGVKTVADVNRLQSALEKERNDHKGTKTKFAVFGDRNPEEVIQLLDRIPELEAAAAGKLDETKLNELVEGRIKTKMAPLERELGTLKQGIAERDGVIDGFKGKDRTRTIHDEVRRAATSQKVLPEALEDALMLAERVFDLDESGRVIAKENVGCTPGVDPVVWFTELQSKRPHWWGPSQGGGAGGSRVPGQGGANPWAHETWNMTEQGKVLSENRTRAEQLAKSAGTSIGGARPAPRK